VRGCLFFSQFFVKKKFRTKLSRHLLMAKCQKEKVSTHIVLVKRGEGIISHKIGPGLTKEYFL